MQQIFKMLCLLLMTTCWACSGGGATTDIGNNTDSTTVTPPVTTEEPTPEAVKDDLSTLEGFWSIFQEAVANKDKSKLMAITNMENMDVDYYDNLFFEKVTDQVQKMGIDALTDDELNGEKIQTMTLDMSDENGATGLILHIGLRDGLYHVSRIRVAGAGL